jgi:putative spermidine/putrescine transport system substrate-binding protein
VIYLTDSYSQLGIEDGLFQKLDRSKIPNVKGLYEIAQAPQGDYGPAYTIGRIGMVYDSAKVKEPITSWNDMWRDDLKGSVSLPGITTTAGPMMVVLAGKHAGVDAYAEPDAAFKAIEALKPNVVKNYNTGSELVTLLSTGEVSVSVAQDFTLAALQTAVPTVKWADLKDGDLATLNTVNIPKGAANVDLAYQFINYILSTEVQQREAETGVDAPVATAVKLEPAQAALWVYGQDMVDSLNRVEYDKMNQVKSDWIDRWNEIFGG